MTSLTLVGGHAPVRWRGTEPKDSQKTWRRNGTIKSQTVWEGRSREARLSVGRTGTSLGGAASQGQNEKMK